MELESPPGDSLGKKRPKKILSGLKRILVCGDDRNVEAHRHHPLLRIAIEIRPEIPIQHDAALIVLSERGSLDVNSFVAESHRRNVVFDERPACRRIRRDGRMLEQGITFAAAATENRIPKLMTAIVSIN